MAILKSIKQSQIVIVTGPDGCGKSSSTFQAALNLEKNDGFKIWIICDTDDILKFSSAETKMIFVFDDAFGRYSVDKSSTKSLSQKNSSLINILKGNTNLKLVMTCRSYIYRSVNTVEIKEPFCHVNYLSEHLKLTLKERQDIGQKYNICSLNDEVIMLYNFFPSLCSKFAERRNDDMIEYFTFPINYIAEEVKQLQKADDPLYIALAVLVVHGNKVERNVLNSDNSKFDRMLDYLSKQAGYKGKPSKSILLSCFLALKNLYVLENESSFEYLRENLFTMIAYCVGPKILKGILDYGKSSLIKEKVWLESIGKNSKFDILVPKEFKDAFFLRLLTDIKKGKSGIVFSSSQHTLPQFRDLFRDYLVTNLKKRLEGEKHQLAVNVVSALHYSEYVSCFEGVE